MQSEVKPAVRVLRVDCVEAFRGFVVALLLLGVAGAAAEGDTIGSQN